MIGLKIGIFLSQPDTLYPWLRQISLFYIVFVRLGEAKLCLGKAFAAAKAGFTLVNHKLKL